MPDDPATRADLAALEAEEELVLGDLLNHVLDKGVVIQGNVTISIANIDLVALDVRLILSSVESMVQRAQRAQRTDARRDAP
jgi:hypothetical protein